MYILPTRPASLRSSIFESSDRVDPPLALLDGVNELKKALDTGRLRVTPCIDKDHKGLAILSVMPPREGSLGGPYQTFIGPEKAIRGLASVSVTLANKDHGISEQLLVDFLIGTYSL